MTTTNIHPSAEAGPTIGWTHSKLGKAECSALAIEFIDVTKGTNTTNSWNHSLGQSTRGKHKGNEHQCEG